MIRKSASKPQRVLNSDRLTGSTIKIDAYILNETVKCRRDFACLSGKTECLCRVEEFINNKILFVAPGRNLLCNYLISFGDSFVCDCPARKEIFRQYAQ